VFSADVRFGLLGSLYVEEGRRALTPSAPKLLQVLAVLLLSENDGVSVTQLADELWDGLPPEGATATVHTYIAQLRRALTENGPSGADRLITTTRGYRLTVRPGELDLHQFRDRLRTGDAALSAGNDELGSRRLRAALGVWRASALVDVPIGPVLRALVAPIERQRLDALCRRIGADLRLGAHREVLSELSLLVRQHPLHERLHEQMMLAQYRSGRQVDALNLFHRLRRELGEEVGSGPGPRLHRLYKSILLADPELESPVVPRTATSLDHLALVGR
jgi:SARP family transcriptional regulator, regulator of embCAB operon